MLMPGDYLPHYSRLRASDSRATLLFLLTPLASAGLSMHFFMCLLLISSLSRASAFTSAHELVAAGCRSRPRRAVLADAGRAPRHGAESAGGRAAADMRKKAGNARMPQSTAISRDYAARGGSAFALFTRPRDDTYECRRLLFVEFLMKARSADDVSRFLAL